MMRSGKVGQSWNTEPSGEKQPRVVELCGKQIRSSVFCRLRRFYGVPPSLFYSGKAREVECRLKQRLLKYCSYQGRPN